MAEHRFVDRLAGHHQQHGIAIGGDRHTFSSAGETRNLGFLKVDQRHDGRGNPYFWIGFERAAMMDTPDAGTDLAALAANYISVTPLRLNRTDEAFSETLAATLK